METLESALKRLLDEACPVGSTEMLPLADSLGRVVSEDMASAIQVPPFDRSPLDGYALHSEDIASASRETPVALRVIGEACAGCGEHFTVGRGEALRIMTGAPVPESCDCVIRQEDTDEGMETALFYASVRHGRNICYAGEDIERGQIIVRKGERLTAAHLGVLASLGVTDVPVYGKPRAALLCTGDELCQPGQPLSYGKIYDSSRTLLTARLTELNVIPVVLGAAEDDAEAVAEQLKEAIRDADIVITTGGVSVGKKDIMHRVLPLMGAERLFWRVAMKPGTPLLCGKLDGKLIICLSGNPFAAVACFEVFVRPVLAALSGCSVSESRRFRTRLCGTFTKPSPSRRLIRAYFDGTSVRQTGDNHSSGSLSTMIGCNALIDIPAGSGALGDGDEVEVILL